MNKRIMYLCIGIGLLALFMFSGMGIYNYLSKPGKIIVDCNESYACKLGCNFMYDSLNFDYVRGNNTMDRNQTNRLLSQCVYDCEFRYGDKEWVVQLNIEIKKK